MKALEKHPAERWQSGEELRQAMAGERPLPAPSGRRRGVVVAALMAAVALIAAVVGLARRSDGPPVGVNPRHSILVLPFDNLRGDPAVEWLRDGSVSMLGLNLSQWNDLSVVDHERLHDLLARHKLVAGEEIVQSLVVHHRQVVPLRQIETEHADAAVAEPVHRRIAAQVVERKH